MYCAMLLNFIYTKTIEYELFLDLNENEKVYILVTKAHTKMRTPKKKLKLVPLNYYYRNQFYKFLLFRLVRRQPFHDDRQ
jgi:hypothetical protein